MLPAAVRNVLDWALFLVTVTIPFVVFIFAPVLKAILPGAASILTTILFVSLPLPELRISTPLIPVVQCTIFIGFAEYGVSLGTGDIVFIVLRTAIFVTAEYCFTFLTSFAAERELERLGILGAIHLWAGYNAPTTMAQMVLWLGCKPMQKSSADPSRRRQSGSAVKEGLLPPPYHHNDPANGLSQAPPPYEMKVHAANDS